jgi:hypothetical protein
MTARVPVYMGELEESWRYVCSECTSNSGMPTYRKSLTAFVEHILKEHATSDDMKLVARILFTAHHPLSCRDTKDKSCSGSVTSRSTQSVRAVFSTKKSVKKPVEEDDEEEDEEEEEVVRPVKKATKKSTKKTGGMPMNVDNDLHGMNHLSVTPPPRKSVKKTTKKPIAPVLEEETEVEDEEEYEEEYEESACLP